MIHSIGPLARDPTGVSFPIHFHAAARPARLTLDIFRFRAYAEPGAEDDSPARAS